MSNLKKAWEIFVPRERRWLLVLLVLLLAASLLELVGLALVIPYVNLMLFDESLDKYLEIFPLLEDMFLFSENYRIDASVWFAGFYLIKNSVLVIMTFMQHAILKWLHANVMQRMYSNTMRKSYGFHLNSNTSDIIRSLTYDAIHFGDGVLVQGGILIAELFLFIGVMVVLTLQNPTALFIMIIMVLPLIFIFMLIKRRLLVWGGILQKREAELIQHLQEGFGGIKDVVVFGVQGYFEQQFSKNVILRSRIKRNRDVTVLVPRFVIETLMMVGMAGALLWLSKSSGLEQNFSVIAFLAVVTVRMLPMSNRIMNSVSTIRSATSSTDVVYESARANREVKGSDYGSQTLMSDEGGKKPPFEKLNVENMSFGYTKDIFLLKDINFSISNGETIGIVGSSGAGKTTLIDILLGLLTPISGSIKQNNNEDIQNDLSGWQQRIGYVQQSIFLLDESIEANIAFGIPTEDIDHERVMKVVGLAKLDSWVSTLPSGVNSKVGERGVSISGGQRQRVGIARALYRDPEILILDEATSALDNRTEKELMSDVYAMKGDRTIILIAHRLETIRQCDRIIVLDRGRIAGIGTYDSLLAENSVFQDISAHRV